MQEYSIGDYSWTAPSAFTLYRVLVGSRVTIGLGAMVTKDIPDDLMIMGSPAREVSKQKQLLTHWTEVISEAQNNNKSAK